MEKFESFIPDLGTKRIRYAYSEYLNKILNTKKTMECLG